MVGANSKNMAESVGLWHQTTMERGRFTNLSFGKRPDKRAPLLTKDLYSAGQIDEECEVKQNSDRMRTLTLERKPIGIGRL